MAILKFSASAVAAQIAHARACKTFLPNWNGPVDKPALILIVGNGVHLRSNGIDGTTTRIVTTEQADPSFAFGGTFRVILKDACDTFAIVQNCGNCEDFDAMQPYRVPLDALMELDDRRVA